MIDQSASHLQALFDTALRDYEKQTGTSLTKHPLVERLEHCHNVESVMAVLEDQSKALREFRGSDGRITKSLKSAVSVLFTLSTCDALDGTISLLFPPTKAIFAGFAILLSAAKDVSSSYDALVDLLESIEHFLNRLEIYTGLSLTGAMAEIIVKILVEVLSTLALVTQQIKQKRPVKFVKKLLGENDVEAVLQRLDRLTLDEARTTAAQTLQVIYGLVQNMRVVMEDGKASLGCVREALELMQQIATDMSRSRSANIEENIRKWLAPPDPWESHNIAHKSRHSGTAEWFIQGNVFSEWKALPTGSLLWVHGKPGAGKTVLCSAVIRNLDARRKAGLASLAFFYCDFREDKKDLRGLLSSLLVQLCHQSDFYCDILSSFYSEHGRGTEHASDDGLIGCLKDLLKLPGQAPVYLVVDALDECPITADMPSPREEVINLINELLKSELPNLRICVTSRPEADVKAVLDPLTSYSISLHNEKGQMRDIDDYIRFVVNADQRMRRWNAKDKQLVIDVLTRRADGMFRWVYCQIAYLRYCLPGRIHQALAELPETLDETYERTLQRINKVNWEFAHRLFQCVSVASRPLSVEELAEFLAFDFGTAPIPKFHEGWRPEDSVVAVLSTCTTLLSVVRVNQSFVVQFSHFSVKEFLTSARLAEKRDTICSRYHVSIPAAHTLVAQACLGLLLHLDGNITGGSLRTFPLAEYAAGHWVNHAKRADTLLNLQDGIRLLFDPKKPHLAVWVWINSLAGSWSQMWWVERPSQPRRTPLHYAALYCSENIVKFLVTEYPEDVNAQSPDDHSTPLHQASDRGHAEIARVLLERGADPNAQNNNGWSSLHRASDGGYAEVVRVLIGHGADVSARDAQGWTPLHWASDRGYVGVTHVLLEHGADPTARDEQGWTPLHRASDQGHVELARVLLERGADVAAPDKYGWTPLRHATHKGRTEVARTLVAHGAGAMAHDECGRASRGGLVRPTFHA